LDEIDARRSLLVIAPTSAGKTFISFYAMKQVLESNNEDVLVYVAPTKALVNQIAAEIQARFSKNYKYSQSVWGIHTRDYRINNPTGCQILVTVPHILQIMLLAPSNAKSWSERVKWIIFDEVHCIGQAEDGLIWEQLLLMAPCPIIALSATVRIFFSIPGSILHAIFEIWCLHNVARFSRIIQEDSLGTNSS
jgi:superfamily II RNA helicase